MLSPSCLFLTQFWAELPPSSMGAAGMGVGVTLAPLLGLTLASARRDEGFFLLESIKGYFFGSAWMGTGLSHPGFSKAEGLTCRS